MEHILVIKLGAFGDVIQAEGALRDVRNHHPDATLTILTRKPFAKLLQRCPWVDAVWIDDNAPRWRLDKMIALRRLLRQPAFSRVYDFQGSRRSAFYFRWMLRDRVWSGSASGMALPHPLSHPKAVDGRERLALQLEAAGVPVRYARHPDLGWMVDPAEAILAASGLLDRPYALLIPGSSARHPNKRWPGFAELAVRLRAAGVEPVTVPGPDEIDLCRALPATAIVRADGQVLDLFALAGVAQRAQLVVGNDTGPTHLAAYLGRPGVALFGGGTKSAGQVGLQVGQFTVLEAQPLADLTVDSVLARLAPAVQRVALPVAGRSAP